MNLRIRLVSSLLGSGARGALTFCTSLLLARALGATDFGRLAFLTSLFMALRTLLDMGSSSAFFTFLSQTPRSRAFLGYFCKYHLVCFFLVLAALGFLLPDQFVHGLWRGEPRWLLCLAFAAVFMQSQVATTAAQMAEAARQTKAGQVIQTLTTLVHLSAVLILWKCGWLGVATIFIAMIIEFGLSGWLLARLYPFAAPVSGSPAGEGAKIFREFRAYCAPFLGYILVGFLYETGDRWMLQRWSGSEQQAYYALASQFSTVVLLAAGASVRVFWKEVSEAVYRGDIPRAVHLYGKFSRPLFFLGACLAGTLVPWADVILGLALGREFLAGTIPLAIMFLYPVHQGLNQIAGTFLLAAGHTGTYTRVGNLFMVGSLIAAYGVLAPTEALVPGLGWGAAGLAAKMVLMQILQVGTIQVALNKNFGISLDWGWQTLVLAMVLGVGFAIKIFLLKAVPSQPAVQLGLGILLASLCWLGLLRPLLSGFSWSNLLSAR